MGSNGVPIEQTHVHGHVVTCTRGIFLEDASSLRCATRLIHAWRKYAHNEKRPQIEDLRALSCIWRSESPNSGSSLAFVRLRGTSLSPCASYVSPSGLVRTPSRETASSGRVHGWVGNGFEDQSPDGETGSRGDKAWIPRRRGWTVPTGYRLWGKELGVSISL